MRLSMRSQFVTSVAAQGFSHAVTIASQLLIVPLLLSIWGADRYGAWLIISALPTYLSMADLGFAQISANDMTMRMARGDADGAVVVNQTAWLMNGSVALLVVVVMVGLVNVVPIAEIFSITAVSDDVNIATFFLALVTVNAILFGVVGGAMRAVGLVSLMVAANAITRLLTFLLLVGGAVGGLGFVGCAIAMYVGSTLNVLLFSALFYRGHRQFLPSTRRADPVLLRKMIAPSLSYMSYTLSNALNIQGVNLLTGYMLGPAAVVIVSTIRTLTRLGRTAASVINYAMEPIFAHFYGQGDKSRQKTAYRQLLVSMSGGTVVFAAGMWLLGEMFLARWTHGAVVDQTLLFRTMLISVILEIFWFTLQTPFVSTNRHNLFALYNLGFSILVFLALIPALHWFGLPGVGWAAVALQGAVLVVTIIIAARRSLHSAQPNT